MVHALSQAAGPIEKTHRSYMALNMLAAAIISFRHVPLKVNIIYG